MGSIGLAERVRRVTERALLRGACVPIETRLERVADGGVDFIVRVAEHLSAKLRAAGPRDAARDPFLPYDRDLYVADAGPAHVVLLNKFNVLDDHLLIVTRDAEPQTAPLTGGDFEALARVMAEIDGLAFYNAGPLAGASQHHKHLQLVPASLARGVDGAPIEPLLVGEAGAEPVTTPGLSYPHALVRLEDLVGLAVPDVARRLFDHYRRALEAVGLGTPADPELPPYNLLITRRWLLLVPRRVEHFEGISVNALGYAGALLVQEQRQLERIIEVGPMRVLAALAGR